MESIQELVFENKEKIPEGLYLEFMNLLKKEYNQSSDYYNIKFMILTPNVDVDDGDTSIIVNINVSKTHEKIIKLNREASQFHMYTASPFVPFKTNLNFDEIIDNNLCDYIHLHNYGIKCQTCKDHDQCNSIYDDDCLHCDENRLINIKLVAEVRKTILVLSCEQIKNI